MILFRSLTFQLKRRSDFSYPRKMDTVNQNGSLCESEGSLVHGPLPLCAGGTFSLVRAPLTRRFVCTVRFSELKFLGKI